MKRPKLSKFVPKKLTKKQSSAPETSVDTGPVTPITNETVAAHREAVLGSARKYIYPLQHSKHRIVIISTSLFVAAFIGFFAYCTLALYRFKSSSSLVYGVTQVVPYPVARAGSNFVSYESYLFELRHYTHYYQSQLRLDFKSEEGKQQLADYKERALAKVVDDAYVKQLAKKYKVSVSDQALNNQITLVRNQNRLGSNEKGFEDVLKDNFGWTVNDFKRSLRQEMLAQKVVATLDSATQAKAKAALDQLGSGTDFTKVAAQFSDDAATKNSGGEYGFLIDATNRDIPAQVTSALFTLKPGQNSAIINTGYSLEIVKNIDIQGDKIHAAHIVFNFKPINSYIDPLKVKSKPHEYIKV
ncbi:MAG TPA: SurA N-terminal domain-containing protein [Patescibacteria group bacterium]|nr:SurA N-terminal domain-containing protein [Patescibacteria group bacterium]